MENKINILTSTLEQMLAYAEDNGREVIQLLLTSGDVKIILDALRRNKPCETEGKVTLGDTEHNSPLKVTVEGMLSSDYKERFKAEYQQTKIRYEKLKAFCNRIEAADRTCGCFYPGSITPQLEMPKHDCPTEMLREQQSIMGQYLHILEVRAVIEGIDLASL